VKRDQPATDDPITEDEVAGAVARLKCGKASGIDEVITEWLIYGGEWMTKALWAIISKAWESELLPEDWSRGIISPIFKDGDPADPLNYRGITLLSVVGKTYASVLNSRLLGWLKDNESIQDEQGGFRPGRGCPEQIFVLSEAVRLRRKSGKRTHACFIDVSKAFDRVWRDGVFKRLRDEGVEGKLYRVIRGIYSRVQSCVQTEGKQSRWFNLSTGVRQGCPLSPTLFAVFIDGLIRRLKDSGLGLDVDGGNRLCSLL
jgi:hypothetical protein